MNERLCNSSIRDGRSDSIVKHTVPQTVDIMENREGHAKFRHGLLQLMLHTIDPLHDSQSQDGKYLEILV